MAAAVVSERTCYDLQQAVTNPRRVTVIDLTQPIDVDERDACRASEIAC